MADATTSSAWEEPAAAAHPPPQPVYLLASFGSRLQARVIDDLIVFIPTLAVWAAVLPALFAITIGRSDAELQGADALRGPTGEFFAWGLLFLFGLWVSFVAIRAVYEAVFQASTAGQTPGRRAAGIRVMRVDGQPLRFWWALYRTLLIRDLLFGTGALLTGGLLAALQYLWPLWDRQRRALHDVVARSRVVQDAERA